jgi:hypothetical protein
VLLGVATVLLVMGVGATKAQADVPAGFYGVNVQQVFDGPSSGWNTDLSAMASGGLSLARIDARWQNVEPNPPTGSGHNYNWSMYDGIVQGLAQHGIRWLPIVAYSTTWSGETPGDPGSAVAPSHIPDFAAYAAALAHRYGPGGSFWTSHPSLTPLPVTDYEIWNEENSVVFWPQQADNAEAYADLYMAARSAIKGAEPQARVLVGGLALDNPPQVTDEIDFVRRMYAHRPDLAGNVDGVALHPYQQNLHYTYMRIAKFRQGLNQIAGPSMPIEITEDGWATTSVPEAARGANLSQMAEDLPRSDCNVDMFLPYTWRTEESNSSDPESWFGIWNRDGSPKPSGQAYLSAVQLMRGMTSTPAPTSPVPICSADYSDPPPPQPAATPTIPHGPRLIVRVRRHKHKRRPLLIVAGQCHAGCKLSVALMTRPPKRHDYSTRVSKRLTGFSSRRQVVKLHIPRRLAKRFKRGRVVVVAMGRNGATTTAMRRVRLH